MKFSLTTLNVNQPIDTLLIGVFEKGELTPSAAKINQLSQSYLSQFLKKGEFEGKKGQTLMLYQVPQVKAERILLVGCGANKNMSPADFRKIITSAIKAIETSKTVRVISALLDIPVEKKDLAWKIQQFVRISAATLYHFDQFKSEKNPSVNIKEMVLAIPDKNKLRSCQKALDQAEAINAGVEYTKNLANLPSNICTPNYVADQAKKLAREYPHLSVKVLEEADMKKLGMNAFLSVTKGSAQDGKLICIEYKGSKKKQNPIALVGKGITFDTGGISLKHAEGMVGMKYDMCGAATVLGTIKAAAELKLPLHIVGILAMAENMPSGTASKPEDIVTSLSGQTIEIMNTDCEGRMVLSDALTYCERYHPDVVIDIATLTGAVVIALGYHAHGLLSNNDALAKDLLNAGIESHDRAWQLPLWDEYQEQLKSPFADMSNTGGRTGGAITAACFLSRFAKKFRWAHLDVAGTAALMGAGNDRYATGRPVPLLVQYLIDRSKV